MWTVEKQRDCVRRHYQENKQSYLDRNRNRSVKIREFLRQYKSTLKCSRCPESDPRCLDFHHIDPKKKRFEIATAPERGCSLDTLKEELEKCIPLCANCHRKETF